MVSAADESSSPKFKGESKNIRKGSSVNEVDVFEEKENNKVKISESNKKKNKRTKTGSTSKNIEKPSSKLTKENTSKEDSMLNKMAKKLSKYLNDNNANRPDYIGLFKNDMERMSESEKIRLFQNTFKYENLQTPLSLEIIKNFTKFYSNALSLNVIGNLNDNEEELYNFLITEKDDYLIKLYDDFVKNKNIQKYVLNY